MKKQTPQHLNTSTSQQPKALPIRLITICGSIQLVSSIAALRTREAQDGIKAEDFENVLLFYNLNQDFPETTRLFQETLEKMAKQLIPVQEVICWEEGKTVNELTGQSANKLKSAPTSQNPNIPIPYPAEIWLNSDFHKEIQVLCNYYDKAKVITYGDGPGVYFTKKCRFIFPQGQKQKPKITLIGSIKNLAKTLSASFVPLRLSGKKNVILSSPITHHLSPIKFTEGYFLFPNAFEEKPEGFPYREIKGETFAKIFREIKPLFDFSFLDEAMLPPTPLPCLPAGRKGEPLPANTITSPEQPLIPTVPPDRQEEEPQQPNDQQPNDQQPNPQYPNDQLPNAPMRQYAPTLTILLTANLSEAKRIEEINELKAYENVLKNQARANDLILIKPHPRDGQMKIKKLKRLLNQHYQNVQVIDGPGAQYIPFELFVLHLLDHYYGDIKILNQKVRIITTSTACLSLAKIYGIKCKIGLKVEDIRRYFRSDRIEDRIAHNRALQRVVDQHFALKTVPTS